MYNVKDVNYQFELYATTVYIYTVSPHLTMVSFSDEPELQRPLIFKKVIFKIILLKQQKYCQAY